MHQSRVLRTLDWQIATRFASALWMALEPNMLEEILKPYSGSKENAFVGSAENAKRSNLKLLLEAGVDVNCKDSNFGDTALHRAASMGSIKTVEFLLDNGANINFVNDTGMTPLMDACAKGKKKGGEVALLLLQRGANASYVRAADNMTAYAFALWGQCSEEVLAALLNAGATPPPLNFPIIRLV
jgi:ankyrin repeat protein